MLTHNELEVRRSATSNKAGNYGFDALGFGVYELKVTHPLFMCNALVRTLTMIFSCVMR